MAIEKAYVPGAGWTHRVVGDPKPFRQYTSEEAAQKREAELAGADTADTDGGA